MNYYTKITDTELINMKIEDLDYAHRILTSADDGKASGIPPIKRFITIRRIFNEVLKRHKDVINENIAVNKANRDCILFYCCITIIQIAIIALL